MTTLFLSLELHGTRDDPHHQVSTAETSEHVLPGCEHPCHTRETHPTRRTRRVCPSRSSPGTPGWAHAQLQPLYAPYELFGRVVVTLTPGAPRSTVVAPSFEKRVHAVPTVPVHQQTQRQRPPRSRHHVPRPGGRPDNRPGLRAHIQPIAHQATREHPPVATACGAPMPVPATASTLNQAAAEHPASNQRVPQVNTRTRGTPRDTRGRGPEQHTRPWVLRSVP